MIGNKSVKYSKINDIKLRNIMIEYLSEEKNFSKRAILMLLNYLKDKNLVDFSWNLMCEHINSQSGEIILDFYKFMYRKECINDQYTPYLKEHSYVLDNFKSRAELYFIGSDPRNIRIYQGHQRNEYMYLSYKNLYLKSICDEFIEYLIKNKKEFISMRLFLLKLEESLGQYGTSIKRIQDFNEKTLERQIKYFKNFPKNALITYLRWFYMFLFDYIREKNIKHELFSVDSGIDYVYFTKLNFIPLFEQGYRVVYLNINDDVPNNDKWLVAPNGRENRSASHKYNDYFPINFERINDKNIRKLVKKYFWTKNAKLKELNNGSNRIIKFFEFMQNENIFSKKVILISDIRTKQSIITPDNILIFKEYLELNYESELTRNGYISTIRGFTNFLVAEGSFIDPLVFEYLSIRKAYGTRNKTIAQIDLKIINEEIMNLLNNGELEDKLFSICIYLMLTTNLRESSILSLETNCIKNGIKSGDYYIDSSKEYIENVEYSVAAEGVIVKTKTSNGNYIEENPSAYAIRAIEIAIEVTNDLRLETKERELKKYVFLKKDSRFDKIDCIDSDFPYRRFKKLLKKVGVNENYTLNDCRHTYMTELFKNAIKSGNFLKAVAASGHTDVRTMVKNYVDVEIKDYLEAFYKVKIGNVNIMGQVKETLDDEITSDKAKIVSNGCGYCNSEHISEKSIACLICSKFITTINRIPFFKEAIKDIHEMIINENIQHEKEHLVSIKKLLVAYLGRLITLKKELEVKTDA